MPVTAQIGFATTILESVATSIGYGIVIAGFVAAAGGLLTGRSREELETNALRNGFAGSLGGIFCLCYDLIAR